MTFTIDKFKAFAAGLVRPNQFKAKIFVPAFLDGIEATNLSDILIESTSLPSVTTTAFWDTAFKNRIENESVNSCFIRLCLSTNRIRSGRSYSCL